MILFDAIFQLDADETATITEQEARALQIIAHGIDTNALWEGKTALTHLFEVRPDRANPINQSFGERGLSVACDARHQATLNIGRSLLAAGADPWAGNPALWGVEHMWNAITLIRLLTEHENAGIILRGPDGGTPLHAMFRRSDHLFGLYTLDDAQTLHPAWIGHTDGAGQTPLHVLWDTIARGDGVAASEGVGITGSLLMMGADLGLVDEQGRCVANYILDTPVAREAFQTEEILNQGRGAPWQALLAVAVAEAQRQRLERSTATLVGGRSNGVRL